MKRPKMSQYKAPKAKKSKTKSSVIDKQLELYKAGKLTGEEKRNFEEHMRIMSGIDPSFSIQYDLGSTNNGSRVQMQYGGEYPMGREMESEGYTSDEVPRQSFPNIPRYEGSDLWRQRQGERDTPPPSRFNTYGYNFHNPEVTGLGAGIGYNKGRFNASVGNTAVMHQGRMHAFNPDAKVGYNMGRGVNVNLGANRQGVNVGLNAEFGGSKPVPRPQFQLSGKIKDVAQSDVQEWPPLYVKDANDPRYKSYQDSSRHYKATMKQDELMGPGSDIFDSPKTWTKKDLASRQDFANSRRELLRANYERNPYLENTNHGKLIDYYKELGFKDGDFDYGRSSDVYSDKVKAIGSYYDGSDISPIYPKPTRPVLIEGESFFKKAPVPQVTNDSGTLYRQMSDQGLDPSFSSRQKLALSVGIQGYKGTAEQNEQLRQYLINKNTPTDEYQTEDGEERKPHRKVYAGPSLDGRVLRNEGFEPVPQFRYGGNLKCKP